MNEDANAILIQRCRDKIAEHGHMVAAIGADVETGQPDYAYTIGVHAFCGYEFAMSGLPVEDMHNALNALARRAREGKLKPSDGLLVEGVFMGEYLPRLRLAHPSWSFGWMLPVLGLDGPVPVWQAQYSTREHKYPGQPGYYLTADEQTDFSQPKGVSVDG